MSNSERLSWAMGAVICVVIPAVIGEIGLAVVGGLSLGVLWWGLSPTRR